MKPDVDQRKMILAIKCVIEDTFDRNKWCELGLLTGEIDVIKQHPRLLKSLSFGDDDYGEAIGEILPSILGKDMENLQAVEEFVELEDWLEDHDSELYADLYREDDENRTWLRRPILRVRLSSKDRASHELTVEFKDEQGRYLSWRVPWRSVSKLLEESYRAEEENGGPHLEGLVDAARQVLRRHEAWEKRANPEWTTEAPSIFSDKRGKGFRKYPLYRFL
jgi:hypothetical protein